ncbi:hypothetical protein QOT17_011458 [Balamuthia mandrillaris]
MEAPSYSFTMEALPFSYEFGTLPAPPEPAASPRGEREQAPAATTTAVPVGGLAPPHNGYTFAPVAALMATYAKDYAKLWDDRKTGAKPRTVSFFRPIAPQGFHSLGDLAVRGHANKPPPEGTQSMLVTQGQLRDGTWLLERPVGFEQVWSDRKTGGAFGRCSIWRPVPPQGYVVMGCVVNNEYSEPDVDVVRCVHESLVTPARPCFEEDGVCMWSDKDSGAQGRCTIWTIGPFPFSQGTSMGTFLAWRDYTLPLTNTPLFSLARQVLVGEEFFANDQQRQQDEWRQYERYLAAMEQSNSTTSAASSSEEEVVLTHFEQQPQISPTVLMIPFAMNTEAAQKAFAAWRQSLWFAPSSFRKEGSKIKVELTPLFTPMYKFDVSATSSYSAEVGQQLTRNVHEIHHHYGRHNGPRTEHHHHEYEETTWRLERGVNNSQYGDLKAYATSKDSTTRKMLKKIGNWKLSEVQAGATDMKYMEHGVMSWQSVWQRFLEKNVLASEKNACASKLRSDYRTNLVRGMQTKTTFTSINYNIIYLPIYEGVCTYNNNRYRFVVNAQTGKVEGEHPFGFGAVQDTWTAIFGSSSEEEIGFVPGSALEEVDKTNGVYDTDKQYLAFPCSKGGIWPVGYIELHNQSPNVYNSVILTSQKRKNKKKFGMCELKAGQKQTFNFRGHWCIQVTEGDTAFIKVKRFNRNGGDAGTANNNLLMVSKD